MGMIFYTLISGKTPFPKSEAAAGMIMRGERPYIDPSWHEGYMQVSWPGSPPPGSRFFIFLDLVSVDIAVGTLLSVGVVLSTCA